MAQRRRNEQASAELRKKYDEVVAGLIQRGLWREAITHSFELAGYALNMAGMLTYQYEEDAKTAAGMLRQSVHLHKDPKVYANLAWMYMKQESFVAAIGAAKEGIDVAQDASCYYNLGIAYKELGYLKEAAEALEAARDLDPTCAMTRTTLADVLFGLGRFREAFAEDEWRFKCHCREFRSRFHVADWDGKSDLAGKRLLVFNEQGSGDAINFARYLGHLRKTGAFVILEVQEELVDLFRHNGLADQVIPRKEIGWQEPCVIHDYDLVKSLQSLVYLFDPDLTNIPRDPYIKPGPTETRALPLVKEAKGLKVGIVWAGSHFHASDRLRSCYLKEFKPLNMDGVQLFSLQKGRMERTWMVSRALLKEGTGEFEVVNLLDDADVEYTDLGPLLNTYNDTAAVLRELDLLVSVDTSVVHLAGAMGVPTWMLLPNHHEWRWLVDWYPSVTILRQRQLGDWCGLLQEAAQKLRLEVDKARKPR